MALLSLVFPKTNTQIDALVLDASISESHQAEVEVTEHPVESGAAIVDHARPKPDSVTIEGVVSNTPLDTTQTDDALTAYAKLLALKDSPKLITIVTELRTYEDMLLTSLSVPRDTRTGDALRFTAVFKRVKLVKNKSTTVTVTKEPKGKKKASAGKQTAEQQVLDAAAALGPKKSLLFKGAESLGVVK